MKLLKPESFRKLCFDILRRYQDKPEHFKIWTSPDGLLESLELIENSPRIANDYYNFDKTQTRIIIRHYGDAKAVVIPELINLLEKSDTDIKLVIKNEKRISSTECIGRLFDKYFLMKAICQFSKRFLMSPFLFWDIGAIFKCYKLYLLDKSEIVLYLL